MLISGKLTSEQGLLCFICILFPFIWLYSGLFHFILLCLSPFVSATLHWECKLKTQSKQINQVHADWCGQYAIIDTVGMAKRPIDIAGMMARRQETEVGAKLFLWSNPPKPPPLNCFVSLT